MVCDFLARQTFLMLHHEHQALSSRYAFEPLQNLLNHDVVEGRPIRTGDCKAWTFCNVGGLWHTLPASMTEEGVHHDSAQPRVERRIAAEAIYRAVCIEKNFLDQVFRIVVVAAEPEGDGVHGSLVVGHQ